MPTLKQYINLFAAISMVLTVLGTVLRATVGPENMGIALIIFGCIVVALSVMAVLEVRGQQKRVSPFDSRYELFGPRMAQCALFGFAGLGIISPHTYIYVSTLSGLVASFIMLMILDECASARRLAGGCAFLLVFAGTMTSSLVLAVSPYEDLKAGIVGLLAIGISWAIARALAYERQPKRQLVI